MSLTTFGSIASNLLCRFLERVSGIRYRFSKFFGKFLKFNCGEVCLRGEVRGRNVLCVVNGVNRGTDERTDGRTSSTGET